jgi:uncharacterized protein (TIGR03435 family)
MLTLEFAASFGRLTANHLWQSTAFAAVAVLLALALRANHARARFWLWLAASVKFLVPFSALAAVGATLGRWLLPATPVSRFPLVMEQIVQPFAPVQYPSLPVAASAPTASLLPALLLALWFCGFVAVLLYEWTRWHRVAAAVRSSTPVTVGRELEALWKVGQAIPPPTALRLVSSTAKLEPGVLGIFRPILWLPAGIGDRLDDAELEVILAHELCHIRRRDNLLATVHMVVEAIFWFHPMVWWLGARLEEERERACDEEVVRMGGEPQVYAESILKVCEFYLASPVACAAGVTGGELKKRIEGIMTNRFTRELNFGKKLLLAVMATAVLAVPIVIGLMNPARSRAQAQTAVPPSFEVASLKAINSAMRQMGPARSPGRFTWTTGLQDLVEYAYHLQHFRISGEIPDRENVLYRVDATMSPAATDDQVRLMLQSLLADRFKMVSHRVTKEADGYNLSSLEGGPKIHEAKEGEQSPPMPESLPESWGRGSPNPAFDGTVFNHIPEVGIVEVVGRKVTMLQLCEELERIEEAVVWDRTGVQGKYYFAFRFAMPNGPDDADAPPLGAALQRSLGLKLEKHKGPVEMLVIDHIEKEPTEN